MSTSRIRLIAAALALVAWLIAARGAWAAVHVVQPGETLGAIAAAHHTTPGALARANGVSDPDLIVVGSRLVVPGVAATGTPSAGTSVSGAWVTVRAGDTLSAIATRTRVAVSALARANAIADPDRIRVGDRLRIPAARMVPDSATAPGRYRVRPGDTLGAIAARFGTGAERLAASNGMRTSDVLPVGRELLVPTPGVVAAPASATVGGPAGDRYLVRPGDTLGGIAARFRTTVAAVAAANGLRDVNVIAVGARLLIPRATADVAAPSPAVSIPVTAATSGWGTHPDRERVRGLIARSAARWGVDPTLIRAIAWQESGWWQGARSSAGAIGVMQLMPGTADWVGPALVGRVIDARDAADNIDGGTAYVAWLLRNAASRDQAVAAYYQGLSSVRSRGLYTDTVAYVAAVNRHYGVR